MINDVLQEKMKGKNKMVPRLLGITKDSIVRVDEKTKQVRSLFWFFPVLCNVLISWYIGGYKNLMFYKHLSKHCHQARMIIYIIYVYI